MRKLLPLIALFGVHCFSYAQTTYPSGVTGCIARWDFTNTGGTLTSLNDVSGNANNGSVSNISTATGWRGGANQAGSFNGTSSIATVAHNAMLSPSAISIIAVVKPTGFYSGSCQDNNIIYKSINYYEPGCWSMRISDNDVNCSSFSPNTEVLDFAGPGTYTGTFTGPIISANNWYFLVTTYDGNIIKRYTVPMDVNNNVTSISNNSSSTIGTPLGFNTNDVSIGGTQNSSFPFWYKGSMDELVLFNKVLTEAEILSVYQYLWQETGITIDQPFTDTIKTPGSALNINYTVHGTGTFTNGNVFIAQLSDATGSFAAPTSIGTKIDTTSGTIACTIPGSTPSGSKYRIRIISTTPAYTSADDGKDIKILSTGISTVASSQSAFTLYPNPGKGSFILTGKTFDNQALNVTITNSIGQVIHKKDVVPNANEINLPIEMNCPNGVYTVRISNGIYNQTIRLTVNK